MALTTLERVQMYLGIATGVNEALIEELILAATDQIERHCDRRFTKADYTEVHFGDSECPFVSDQYFSETGSSYDDGPRDVLLRNWPITNVLYAGVGKQSVIDVQWGGTGLAQLDLTPARLYYTTAMTAASAAFTATGTLGGLASTINGLTGFTASISSTDLNNYPVKGIYPQVLDFMDGAQDGSTSIQAVASQVLLSRSTNGTHDDTRVYRMNRTVGVNQPLVVTYNGGYADADLPAGLVDIATKIVVGMYLGRKQSGGMESEEFGDYSYKRGTIVSGDSKRMTQPGVTSYIDDLALYCNMEQ